MRVFCIKFIHTYVIPFRPTQINDEWKDVVEICRLLKIINKFTDTLIDNLVVGVTPLL